MGEPISIAAEYARALAKPMRLRIVAALADGPRTTDSLAHELKTSESSVVRHLRALQGLGLVQPRGAAGVSRAYDLLRDPLFSEAEYDALPLPVKRAAAGATLAQMQAKAAAAIDTGGFDRSDMHLSRIGTRVTEEQWAAMSQAVAEVQDRMDLIKREAEALPAEDTAFRATAIFMLFTNEHPGIPPDEPRPDFGETEAHARMIDLVERLHDVVVEPTPEWDRVKALAAELRLIADATMSLCSAAPRHAERQP
jgi:DNA-binding transcriptional ArsR family regulator